MTSTVAWVENQTPHIYSIACLAIGQIDLNITDDDFLSELFYVGFWNLKQNDVGAHSG